ncbi:MAG: hypothetical protein ACJASL_002103 [Paraglaciecola sp.]|jgi:hypothetical protein
MVNGGNLGINPTKALIAQARYINMRATLRQATKLINLIFVWCSTSGWIAIRPDKKGYP